MSTAVAHPNIALIKYWGKAHEQLILPSTDSVSLTLDALPTTTTVMLIDSEHDEATINGEQLAGNELHRVTAFLDRVRQLAGASSRARVTSINTVATAAGLASSAAGFAALACASADAYGLALSARELSRLARRGSGSASRSLFGGLVQWHRGTTDETSYAEPLTWNGPELGMLITQVSTARKSVSSRAGMQSTISTSPYYTSWVSSNNHLAERAVSAINDGDFTELGKLTELSTMRMHATMLAAEPPLRYLNGHSFAVLDAVQQLRADGIEAYATADAGPNIKILCRAETKVALRNALAERFSDLSTLAAGVGPGAILT